MFDHKAFLKTLTTQPGVYKMSAAGGRVLYVGKAKNLKRRVSSYFQKQHDDPKTAKLVSLIQAVDVIVTHTEAEALILERNLIRSLKPKFNIIFRDDKSYPYIHVSTDQAYPRFSYYRGNRKKKGRFFGPFPSAGAVRETLKLLQKVFKVRQCDDTFYANRSRPCLQYQIKRCSAPCVKAIDETVYNKDVKHALLFLEGKSDQVSKILTEQMEVASERQDYETAAVLRDRIFELRKVQQKQYVDNKVGDYDVVAAAISQGEVCVELLFIRDGRLLGHKHFFPKTEGPAETTEALEAFLEHYYLGEQVSFIPRHILVNDALPHKSALSECISEHVAKKVLVQQPKRGDRLQWLKLAETNAQSALSARQADDLRVGQRVLALQTALNMPELPQSIECFDVSHTFGELTVASCVVFKEGKADTSQYRRFNIKDITPGDDYAALRQALIRRYSPIKEKDESLLPSLLLIDGGKGQLNQAISVFKELQIEGVTLVGVAKGPERKAGMETLILGESLGEETLAEDSLALHLIQEVRDEAHRFAITGHRKRRAKAKTHSRLEDIEGVGSKKRQAVLKYFGGLQGVKAASVEELSKVPGISRVLAQRIYDGLQN